MTNSRLLQITPWALLEFEYSSKTLSTSNANFLYIDNQYTDYIQISNEDNCKQLTANVLDWSVSQLGSRKWVHQDRDIAIPYLETDQLNLPTTYISDETVITWNVVYDKVKLHILSGYTFEDTKGFIFEILYPEKNNVKKTRIAQYSHITGDENIQFNKIPIYLGGRVYDKYIEFYVPSLSWLVSEFDANLSNPEEELAYYFTSDNLGFLTNGLIYFNLYNIEKSEIINGINYLTTSDIYNVQLEQQDLYSSLSAVIEEVDDYFVYYPTWESGFIEDYIGTLNSVKGDYIVIHDLVVSEQVGYSEIITHNIATYQDSGFDAPMLFRPVIVNSDSAYSFSIDYTMRLTDRNSGSQIIRRASITSFQPKKYGKKLTKLNLRTDLQPYRVVNKVVKGSVISLPNTTQTKQIERVYFPTFIEKNNLSISTGKLFLSSANELIPDNLFEWDIIFGQGEGYILVSPYDNFFKFTLYKISNNKVEVLNLSGDQEVYLIFRTPNQKEYRFTRYIGSSIKAEEGQVLFKVPASDSQSILSESGSQFFITLKSKSSVRCRVKLELNSDIRGKEVVISNSIFRSKFDSDFITVFYNSTSYEIQKKFLEEIEIIPDGLSGDETVIYTGNYDDITHYNLVLNKINDLRNLNLQTRLNNIKSREDAASLKESKLSKLQEELDSRKKSLDALQQSLTGKQQQLNESQNNLIAEEKKISEQSALLKLQQDQLAAANALAKSQQNASQQDLSDLLKTIRDQLGKINPLNTGTTGTTGTTGPKNNGIQIKDIPYDNRYDLSFINSKTPNWIGTIGIDPNTGSGSTGSNGTKGNGTVNIDFNTYSDGNKIITVPKDKVSDFISNPTNNNSKYLGTFTKEVQSSQVQYQGITISTTSSGTNVSNGETMRTELKNIPIVLVEFGPFYDTTKTDFKSYYFRQKYTFEIYRNDFYNKGLDDIHNGIITTEYAAVSLFESHKIKTYSKKVNVTTKIVDGVSNETINYGGTSFLNAKSNLIFDNILKSLEKQDIALTLPLALQYIMTDPYKYKDSGLNKTGYLYVQALNNICANRGSESGLISNIEITVPNIDILNGKLKEFKQYFLFIKNQSGNASGYLPLAEGRDYLKLNTNAKELKSELISDRLPVTEFAYKIINSKSYKYDLYDTYERTDYIFGNIPGTTKNIFA